MADSRSQISHHWSGKLTNKQGGKSRMNISNWIRVEDVSMNSYLVRYSNLIFIKIV